MASTAAVMMIAGGAVAWDVAAIGWAHGVAEVAVLLLVALEFSAVTRGCQILLAACVVVAATAALVVSDVTGVLLHGLSGAAFVIGLFSTLSLLRDAAETSTLVRQCGELMVRQPPGRRYLVLSFGSHLISIILNFGVLTLLGTMIQRGNTLESAGGDARIAGIRTQRMMTATLRGFAMMTVWSPLTVAFTITQSSIPGLDWGVLVPLQMVLAVLLLGLGWGLDRRAFPAPLARPMPAAMGESPGMRPVAGLTALIAAVVTGSVVLAGLLSIRPVVGAMMVVPVSAWIWLTVQRWPIDGFSAPGTALLRLGKRLTISMPAFRNEFVIVGSATFMGIVGAAMIPIETTAALLSRLPLPPAVIMVLLVWAMMAAARYGVPQIVSVALVGHAISSIGVPGYHPLVLASGLMGAWGLSACTTPVGAATISIARMSGVTTQTVAREWNGLFVASGATLVGAWMLGLSVLVP